MLCKVTHGAVCVLAHQLCWDNREMGTAISFTECSQMTGLIQKRAPQKHVSCMIHESWVLHAIHLSFMFHAVYVSYHACIMYVPCIKHVESHVLHVLCTIEWEIFTLKIIHVKNFHGGKISRFCSIIKILLMVDGYNRNKRTPGTFLAFTLLWGIGSVVVDRTFTLGGCRLPHTLIQSSPCVFLHVVCVLNFCC